MRPKTMPSQNGRDHTPRDVRKARPPPPPHPHPREADQLPVGSCEADGEGF